MAIPTFLIGLLPGYATIGLTAPVALTLVPGLGYGTWALVSGFVAGLACGFLNTVASSGSAVSLPILLMIGLDPVSANATNRIPVLVGALSATWSFHRRQGPALESRAQGECPGRDRSP
jgi:hypothetical protein